MLARSLVPLALFAGVALALSPADISRAVALLEKRDFASDAESAQNAALGLVQSAGTAISQDGKCSTECNGWVTTISGCSTDSADETAIAGCACGSSVVSSMDSCASCLGGDVTSQALTFKGLCTSYASLVSAGSLSGAATATGSGSGTSNATNAAGTTGAASATGAANGTGAASAPGASQTHGSGAAVNTAFGGAAVVVGALAVAVVAL